jgi:peroxiredoxin
MKDVKSFIVILALSLLVSVAASAQVSLTALDGTRVDLEAQKGKVVVLAVGAAWLPLSGKQADYANALAKKYAGKNVVFYYIATDSNVAKSKNFASDQDIRKFVAANKLNMPVLRDGDGAIVLKKFDIDQIPSFVILDKTGRQVGESYGGIDPKYDITIPLSKAIDKIL